MNAKISPDGRVTRRQFLKAALAATAATGVLAAGGAGLAAVATPHLVDVERVQIALRGLSPAADGVRIVQLSDFHLYPFTKLPQIERAVTLANRLDPDVVVLTGDFVLESAESIFDLAPALAALNPRFDLFAVHGNHDHWTDHRIVEAGLAASGIRLLKNERVTLGNGLTIAGLDDPWSGWPDLSGALDGVAVTDTVVLLAHEPDFIDRFAADPRVGLMLSGHTHGGQVNLPLVGPPYLPRFGRKYLRGHYRVRDAQLYVNRGIGVTAGNLRLGAVPEVTEITLVRA